MKKLLISLGVILAIYFGIDQGTNLLEREAENTNEVITESIPLSEAFAREMSGIQVTGSGTVVRVLSDDNRGSRHQRFIIRLASGQTLLIAHNIDIAPRVVALQAGDNISFEGEYEWNEKGGVVHWTHHDPDRSHTGGWLRHKGETYQ